MKVSEVLVRILEIEGITDIFGIPGAGINSFYQFLGQSSKIKHYTVRHEECAVHAASAYFRSSGKLAAASCTSGPGATNFVTGLYTSNIDSIPLIAITGQGNTALIGKDAFQCVNMVDIARPVCKAVFCITDASKAIAIFQNAFKIAREGKPGPVVLDFPLDIQQTEIEFDPTTYKPLSFEKPKATDAQIQQAIDMLTAGKNPVIIMGGGVVLANACDDIVRFAEILQIPVITTYMAKGGIPINHPLNAGHAGIQVGQPIGNKILCDSDVVLGIGCRFTDRHTGALKEYKGDRKFIHINIEPSELDKIFKADLGIVSDAKIAIEMLIEKAKTVKAVPSERVAHIPQLREELKRKTDYECEPIKPQRVYAELNKCFDEDTMFTTGCGITQIWSGQLQDTNKPNRYLPSGGSGTLGYDIPAAFGAMIASPGNKAVAVMGDFGFTFHIQELATAAKYDIPLVVVIVNNAYLGLIKQNQKYAYGYEYAVEMKVNHTLIDYVKIAEGFGCEAERVFKPGDIAAALERSKKSKKPYVIDIVCEEQTDCSMGGAINNIREFV
ncbi:MAG TPA: thiamine pyrophosphate-dependent enzyme [Ruminiclostridium sp.]